MLQILKMIVIAAAGVALGLMATFFAVERSQDWNQDAPSVARLRECGAVFLGAVLQRARIDDADLSDAVLFGADLAGWTGVARSTRGLVLDRVRIAGGAA